MDNATMYAKLKKHSGKINAYAALCQLNWETRSGGKPWSSELFLKANNGAGIKAGTDWNGDIYDKVSWEQKPDGTKYDKKSSFRKYASVDAFIADYVAKIGQLYPVSAEHENNMFGYIAGLLRGKWGAWATDKEYFNKLCGVIVELAPETFGKGELWRNKLLTAFDYAQQKRSLTTEQATFIYGILNGVTDKSVAKTVPVHVLSPSLGISIFLDAGHGGSDSGASYGNILEKNLTKLMTIDIGKELVKRGYDVHYSRTSDIYIGRAERARMANRLNCNALLSVHGNSAKPNPKPSGFEIWTTRGQNNSDILATDIFNAYQKLIGGPTRKDMTDGDPDKENDWTVIYLASMPAVLMECGFISNPQDRDNMLSSTWRNTFACAVANGVDNYFRSCK